MLVDLINVVFHYVFWFMHFKVCIFSWSLQTLMSCSFKQHKNFSIYINSLLRIIFCLILKLWFLLAVCSKWWYIKGVEHENSLFWVQAVVECIVCRDLTIIHWLKFSLLSNIMRSRHLQTMSMMKYSWSPEQVAPIARTLKVWSSYTCLFSKFIYSVFFQGQRMDFFMN